MFKLVNQWIIKNYLTPFLLIGDGPTTIHVDNEYDNYLIELNVIVNV